MSVDNKINMTMQENLVNKIPDSQRKSASKSSIRNESSHLNSSNPKIEIYKNSSQMETCALQVLENHENSPQGSEINVTYFSKLLNVTVNYWDKISDLKAKLANKFGFSKSNLICISRGMRLRDNEEIKNIQSNIYLIEKTPKYYARLIDFGGSLREISIYSAFSIADIKYTLSSVEGCENPAKYCILNSSNKVLHDNDLIETCELEINNLLRLHRIDSVTIKIAHDNEVLTVVTENSRTIAELIQQIDDDYKINSKIDLTLNGRQLMPEKTILECNITDQTELSLVTHKTDLTVKVVPIDSTESFDIKLSEKDTGINTKLIIKNRINSECSLESMTLLCRNKVIYDLDLASSCLIDKENEIQLAFGDWVYVNWKKSKFVVSCNHKGEARSLYDSIARKLNVQPNELAIFVRNETVIYEGTLDQYNLENGSQCNISRIA